MGAREAAASHKAAEAKKTKLEKAEGSNQAPTTATTVTTTTSATRVRAAKRGSPFVVAAASHSVSISFALFFLSHWNGIQ